MMTEKARKAYADVLCKLCVQPEGDSRFVRVGKHKVRHGDCSGAWPAEDSAKGLKHLLGLQVERAEREMDAVMTKDLGGQDGEGEAAGGPGDQV